MKSEEASTYSYEAAFAAVLMAIAYKIYKMKIGTHSKCCGEGLEITTNNPGMSDP